MNRRRAGGILRGLTALLVLTALTAGLPLAMLRLGGSPIPGRLPSWQHVGYVLTHQDNGGLFLGAVRDVSWLAWIAFTIAVLAEAQAALSGRPAPRLHLAGLQGAAGRLVAIASLTFTTPVAVTLAASPAMAAITHAPRAGHEPPARATAASEQVKSAHAMPATRTVVVRPGDCLWTIALHYLGSGDRYPEIVRLNLGHAMGAGEIFSDPSVILPGWQLRLPETPASPSSAGQHRTGPRHVGTQPRPVNQHDGHPSGSPYFSGQHGAASRDIADQTTADRTERPSAEHTSGQHDQVGQVVQFTLGLLSGAALASLERLRQRQRQHRRPGRRIALPADEASVRIEQKLRATAPTGKPRSACSPRSAAAPWSAAAPPAAMPRSVAEALRSLSEGVAASGDALPPIVGVHLSAGAIDVLLSAPATGPPPAPFTIAPARQAMCWTADLEDEEPGGPATPPAPGEVGDLLPGLFTAGATDGGGYLLLDLEAMRVTCCDGPGDLADRLLVTAATELAASRWSSWYELVLAGCDELDVLGRAEQCADLDEALDLLEDRAAAIARRVAAEGQADVRTRRMEDPEDEDWGLTLLVSRIRPTPAQMSRLLDLADGPGGIAALVAGDTRADDGKLAPALFDLSPDPDVAGDMIATITLAYLGPRHQITVWPQTLTVSEYEALAGAFATAAQTDDVGASSPPYDEIGDPALIRFAAAPVDQVATAEGEGFARPVAGPEPDISDWPGGDWPGGDWPGSDWSDNDWPDRAGITRSWRHQDMSPRRGTPGLAVSVLGPFEILGSAEPLQPKQAELVLALALHSPVGLSSSSLCGLLGPDVDHPRPPDSVRQLITRTRRRLGQDPGGREYITHLGSGIYVLHEDVRLDWAGFAALARTGRTERNREDLRSAMSMVRGQPFADCFHWWIDIALIETIRAEIVDSAELLAQLELAAGDPLAARRAARAGLAAETAAEQLWRALMRAEFEAGNPAGVTAAWGGCLDAIAEIAPGAEPHPDTERLYRDLTRSALPAGLQ